MAEKTFYATRDFKHPRYSTRMLRAGDSVELDAPTARLYKALGAISSTRPRGQRPAAEPTTPTREPAPEAPAKPKRAARRRKAKK